MKIIIYGIAFIFSVLAVYSHFIMDNRYLPYVFIPVFFISLYKFNKQTLSDVIRNRIFVFLLLFYIFYFFNMKFSYETFNMDAWSFQNMKNEIIGIFIILSSFILIMGQKNSSILFHYFYSFISITFILSLIAHFTDYNSIYNKNFYGYHAFLFMFYFNIKNIKNNRLFYIVSIFLLIINYFSFNSRTTTVAIIVYLLIYSFGSYFLKSGYKTLFFSIIFFGSVFYAIFYYTFFAIENSSIVEYNFSGIGGKGFFGRLGIWLELFQYILEKPWFGYGSNISSEYMYSDIIKRSLSAHNTYLDILFRNGIVGLLLVLLVFAQIIKYFYNNSHSNYSLSAISFLFSTLFMAAGYEIIFFTILSVNLFFWCGFAFLVNQIEISKKKLNINLKLKT